MNNTIFHYKHRRRFEQFMKFVGMKSELDELRCPRCGILIKEAGVPFNHKYLSFYTNHINSLRCRVVEKYGEYSGENVRKYFEELMGEAPLCKCGCGRKVKFNIHNNRWNDFAAGVCAARYFGRVMKIKRIRRFLNKIKDGEIQNEVWRRLNIDSKTVSRKLILAERMGLIKRVKVNNNGVFTYKIIKRGGDVES